VAKIRDTSIISTGTTLSIWARYLVIVVSALGYVNIPFGTLKGIYSMWILLQDETINLFTTSNEKLKAN